MCSVVLSAKVKRSLRGKVKIWLKSKDMLINREHFAWEQQKEKSSPVYVQGKLYVTCVRLGHDTRDLVKLLALMPCRGEIVNRREAGVKASEEKKRKELSGAARIELRGGGGALAHQCP